MRKILAVTVVMLSVGISVSASSRRSAALDRIQTSSTILTQIMSAPDSAIPDSIMSGAKCVAVIPSNMKASFLVGANYGKGVATCRTATGWSSPVFFLLTGGSFGFQAGGQASDLVLIIRTDQGMQHLLQSKFKLGADASAAAGPVGRDAQAATDLTMRAQVLTYSRARGLFLGVSLGGAVIRQDQADTQAFYGKDYTFYSLLNGEVPVTQPSQVFLNTMERYAPTRKAALHPAPVVTPGATVTTPATAAPTASTKAPSATSATTASETSTGAVTSPASAVASDSEQPTTEAIAAAPVIKAGAPVPAAINDSDADTNH